MSYPEEGSPMDPSEHESHNIPQATEHYAGDVIPFPKSGGKGPDPRATPIFTGRIKPNDPKVVPAY